MKNKIIIAVVLTYLSCCVYSASILDYLSLDAETREQDQSKKSCLCNGPSCICCVDFNMSLIDLGGPGCVRLKYLSQEEGIAMNVSYGDSLLQSNTVKGPHPEPTCLNIFTKLAQMCAKFTELVEIGDGLRGCIRLEPQLLGETQIELPIGCFNMGPDGMKMIESDEKEKAVEEEKKEEEPEEKPADDQTPVEENKEPENGTSVDDTLLEGITAADIISAVSEASEEGISLISKWLGFIQVDNATNNSDVQPPAQNTTES